MPTLLHLDSSPLESSISRELTREFVKTWKAAHPDGEIIYRDLAANVALATVRLGHGRRNRRDVDWKPALVRGGIFLGNWWDVASRTHSESALRISRPAIL